MYVRPSGLSPQDLPEIEDASGQIAFLNENARPDFLHQLIFLNDVPGPLDQYEKGLQVFWRNWNTLAVAHQHLLLGVEAKGAEFVNVLCFQGRAHRKKFPINLSELLKDISGTFSAPC